ncbi:putative Ig domain-containing protein [Ramlibacter rhizophilus]|uniref:Dystroglycan-type cadherin-like domain-containing protein n=1 Tax=Ramlibacter rhizophilus TaxID=1781167 RepID=A0A4Z0BTA2_9BURK|nr:putative Ig domain-containing protein [Ramlibacter rhizophilus]TFZ01468.1 hypothetical protein EZ242_08840 [Ramlibacter rhizophilus]
MLRELCIDQPQVWEPLPVNLAVNSHFNAALTPPPRDPLVLDLDGDGIETTPIDDTPTLFDHNADGILTATGWIAPDDALVVLDLDGNGRIDSGRELFGDNTRLPDGTLARDGFEALAQHDANGDGRIDAADPVYGRLQLWRDVNGDGVSQSGELSALADSGIASINAVGTPHTQALGHGNTQVLSGGFTRTDGGVGGSGTTELSGSLLLASNNFFRTFTDNPELSDSARALPQMRGSGWVRDLREAMSLGTPEAAGLEEAVRAFAESGDRTSQRGELLRNVVDAWAESSGRLNDARFLYPLITEGNIQTTGGLSELADAMAFFQVTFEGMTYMPETGDRQARQVSAESVDFMGRLHVLEVFNGSHFVQVPVNRGAIEQTQVGATNAAGASGGGGAATGRFQFNVTITGPQVAMLEQAWTALSDSVYAALVLQTRLKPYLDAINIVIDEDGVRLDGSAMATMLAERHTTDALAAGGDLVDLVALFRPQLIATGQYQPLMDMLREWAAVDGDALRAMMADYRITVGDSRQGSLLDEVMLGGAANDTLYGEGGSDVLDGGAANDQLFGGNGDDTLSGGAGDDHLVGGAGNDTYVWGAGQGHDTISEQGNWPSPTEADVIALTGLRPWDVKLETDGNQSLILRILETDETLLVQYGLNPSQPYQQVERLQFADGTEMDMAAVREVIARGGLTPPPNTAPVAGTATLPAVSTAAGEVLSLQLPQDLVTDADAGDTLAWRLDRADGSGLPEWLSFDPALLFIEARPGHGDAGEWGLRLQATDRAGASANVELMLWVSSAAEREIATEATPETQQLGATEAPSASGAELATPTASAESVHADWLFA